MKKLLLLSVFVQVLFVLSTAQVTDISVEVFYTDDGTIAGYPEGHTTYRIYANTTHATDRLTAVYGNNNSPLFLRISGNGIWNHALGDVSATSIDCGLFDTEPALEYDSYVTLGYTCNNGSPENNDVQALDDPNTTTWAEEAFQTAPYGVSDIVVNTQIGGLWFGLHTHDNTEAGDELKILLAQITTDGDLCGVVNLQVFPEYSGVGSEYIEQTGLTFGSLPNAEITISVDVDPVLCYGDENASITVNAEGGTGELSFSFDNEVYTDNPVLGELGAGAYHVYVMDESGCIATAEVVITEPDLLTASAEVSGITCHGSEDGSILILHEGGTPLLAFSLYDNDDYTPSPLFENLSAGVYSIYVMDANGCKYEEENAVTLTEPEALQADYETVDITCYGLSNGEILIFPSGGVAPYEFNVGEGFSIENPITNLAHDNYTVHVRDANGCEYILPMVPIGQPTAIEVIGLEPVNIDGDLPGGNTPYTVQGGIYPYEFEWTDEDGNVVSTSEDLQPLYGDESAGTYTLTITDDWGCTFTTSIEVGATVNIEELAGSFSVNVFPNPTDGLFALSVNTIEAKKVSYQITDATGRVILSKDLGRVSVEYREQMDISNLSAGIYFLKVDVADVQHIVRLIKG